MSSKDDSNGSWGELFANSPFSLGMKAAGWVSDKVSGEVADWQNRKKESEFLETSAQRLGVEIKRQRWAVENRLQNCAEGRLRHFDSEVARAVRVLRSIKHFEVRGKDAAKRVGQPDLSLDVDFSQLYAAYDEMERRAASKTRTGTTLIAFGLFGLAGAATTLALDKWFPELFSNTEEQVELRRKKVELQREILSAVRTRCNAVIREIRLYEEELSKLSLILTQLTQEAERIIEEEGTDFATFSPGAKRTFWAFYATTWAEVEMLKTRLFNENGQEGRFYGQHGQEGKFSRRAYAAVSRQAPQLADFFPRIEGSVSATQSETASAASPQQQLDPFRKIPHRPVTKSGVLATEPGASGISTQTLRTLIQGAANDFSLWIRELVCAIQPVGSLQGKSITSLLSALQVAQETPPESLLTRLDARFESLPAKRHIRVAYMIAKEFAYVAFNRVKFAELVARQISKEALIREIRENVAQDNLVEKLRALID